ncbi:hypothetical protein [Streptomyces sp. NPDC097640]|uniref:hypothetical protein n=1 Tax=Streptomyces sp. NPDC097640 TaxID=3157229 RepID=UPI003320251C
MIDRRLGADLDASRCLLGEDPLADGFECGELAGEFLLCGRAAGVPGWEIDPEDLAQVSPYLTEHIKRFGEYSTHELGIQPEAYDPKLDVDFTQLREQEPAASGFGTAA